MNTYGFTKKIALVGTGFVGMSFAYAMLCESVCDELVLIDVNKQKAEGEAKALQIKGSSINANPKIIQLEWINKWDGKLPVYQLGSSQGIIMNLPSEK